MGYSYKLLKPIFMTNAIFLEISLLMGQFYEMVDHRTIFGLTEQDFLTLGQFCNSINCQIADLAKLQNFANLKFANCFIGIDAVDQPFLTINEQFIDFFSEIMENIND